MKLRELGVVLSVAVTYSVKAVIQILLLFNLAGKNRKIRAYKCSEIQVDVSVTQTHVTSVKQACCDRAETRRKRLNARFMNLGVAKKAQ